jgi:hypothetical protein
MLASVAAAPALLPAAAVPEAAAATNVAAGDAYVFTLSNTAETAVASPLPGTTTDVANYLGEVQSNLQRGPVLTGVRDTATGEMFFAQNLDEVPSNLHPLLQDRLASYMGQVEDGSVQLNPVWDEPGTHSDFAALNQALLRRDALGLPIKDLGELEMYNVSLWSNRIGSTVPRCGNCQVLTDGVTVLSGR